MTPNPSTTPEARETPPQALVGTFNGREAALRRGLRPLPIEVH